jgi:predicted NodU family carbamoyl transferase
LSENKVISWVKEPMEFGPHALGTEAFLQILLPKMFTVESTKVKLREGFYHLVRGF